MLIEALLLPKCHIYVFFLGPHFVCRGSLIGLYFTKSWLPIRSLSLNSEQCKSYVSGGLKIARTFVQLVQMGSKRLFNLALCSLLIRLLGCRRALTNTSAGKDEPNHTGQIFSYAVQKPVRKSFLVK